MSRLLIYVELAGDESAAFTDAFNEWARIPDVDALMARTTDTPTGDPESDYRFATPPAAAGALDDVREALQRCWDCGQTEGAVRAAARKGLDALALLEVGAVYERGYIDGLAAYAYSSGEPWAENGVQYVGTTGTTLRQAKEQARETWNFAP